MSCIDTFNIALILLRNFEDQLNLVRRRCKICYQNNVKVNITYCMVLYDSYNEHSKYSVI